MVADGKPSRHKGNGPRDQEVKVKARASARASHGGRKSHSCRGQGPHLAPANKMFVGEAMNTNNRATMAVSLIQVRRRVEAWEAIGESKVLTQAIKYGVKAPLRAVPPVMDVPPRHPEKLQPLVQKYVEEGALRPLKAEVAMTTRSWVP